MIKVLTLSRRGEDFEHVLEGEGAHEEPHPGVVEGRGDAHLQGELGVVNQSLQPEGKRECVFNRLSNEQSKKAVVAAS